MPTAMITQAGVTAMTTAASNALQLNITGAVFGSTIISSNQTVLAALTSLPNTVYTTDNSVITYTVIDSNNVLFRIRLSNNVGDFDVGSFGLLAGSTLVAVESLDLVDHKYKSTTTASGNIRFYEIIVNINNFANIANLSILISNDASLPEVPTEAALPPATGASFPVYFVHQWTQYHNLPALASRYNNQWYYYPCFEGMNRALFDSNVLPGMPVYFNTVTGRFSIAVANSTTAVPVAMCGPGYSLINVGGTYVSPTNIYTPGANYYISAAPNANGALTTVANLSHVGYAISANMLVLNSFPDVDKVVIKSLTLAGDTNIGTKFNMVQNDAPSNGKNWTISLGQRLFSIGARDDLSIGGFDFLSVQRSFLIVNSLTLSISGGTSLTLQPNYVYLGIPYTNNPLTNNYLSFNNTAYDLHNGNTTINSDGTILNMGNITAYVKSENNRIGMYAPTQSFIMDTLNITLQNSYGGYIQLAGNPGVNPPDTGISLVAHNVSINTTISNYPPGGLFVTGLTRFCFNSDDTRLGLDVNGNQSYSQATVRTEFATYEFDLDGGHGVVQKLPGGLMIITGYGKTSGGEGDVIYFPEAFRSKVFSVQASEGYAYGWDQSLYPPGSPTIFGTAPRDLGSFVIFCARITNGSTSVSYQPSDAFSYIAIGR